MNQQPDKFFREKLGSYQKAAPAAAWTKISANLDKKNNTRPWLKVAATLLLLAMAAWFLWPKNPPELVVQSQEAETLQKKDSSGQHPTTSQVPDPAVNAIASPASPEVAHVQPKQKKRAAKNEALPDKHVAAVNEPEGMVEPLQVPVQEAIIESVAVAETRPELLNADKPVTEDEGVTLVITAEEVNEKYLDKKALAEATSRDKKPSTLRKLLTKAYDLKHNQDPFGDLRQKKNEILALNFIGEKQRSQNK